MGLIHPGIPQKLALALQADAAISHFVETGTLSGTTTDWAARHFDTATTVEAHRPLFDAALRRFAARSNVEVIFGNSADVLPGILSSLHAPALFWLDAHWSGEGTGGEENECPLLAEIDAILGHRTDHILLVDDARFFLAPPHMPLNVGKWPDFEAIIRAVRTLSPDAFIAVFDDVIVIAPEKQKACIVAFLRNPDSTASRPRWAEEAEPPSRGTSALHKLWQWLRGRT
jgi:hypothetical protein